jgi:hypothetical protein
MQDEQGRKQGTKVVKQKSLQFIQTKNKKKEMQHLIRWYILSSSSHIACKKLVEIFLDVCGIGRRITERRTLSSALEEEPHDKDL